MAASQPDLSDQRNDVLLSPVVEVTLYPPPLLLLGSNETRS